MGTKEGINGDHRASSEETQKILMVFVGWCGSFLVSLTGGLILAWWVYEFHPANRQLWMVPFGLVLFVTPLIVWLSVLISEICSWKNGHVPSETQVVPSPDNSIPDPER
ncbi:hypothetical protein FEM48_Zijuj08G0035200 [Ziziphus jujuba var. spinosa]|uniref:Uncharacterized protein n=1 Tax=Ziziphus jujuba var. spinosa TaxID=714518 RepID=A0A978UWR4_ZIZJJ|nr:hypothetical protein FEM48_Zijuj08G0035200 [Ziziphus jujuba var. spinosa]